MRSAFRTVVIVTATVMGAVACAGTGGDGSTGDPQRGRPLFADHCAQCHGPQGGGTQTGPPLVHEYYVPSHHSAEAFQLAVRNGVQPHHWDFGRMPAVEGLSREDVTDIVAHVRDLQREAGLIE